VTLPRGVLDDILQHARDAAPHECCGILVGTRSGVVEAVRAANLSSHPARYEIDPRDHFAARRSARARQLAVVGFYHSHPHSPPYPSETDRAEALYDDVVYLIAGRSGHTWTARAFRIVKGVVEDVPLLVTEERGGGAAPA
jgi:proteasome lid subunit RPN8/RPN11